MANSVELAKRFSKLAAELIAVDLNAVVVLYDIASKILNDSYHDYVASKLGDLVNDLFVVAPDSVGPVLDITSQYYAYILGNSGSGKVEAPVTSSKPSTGVETSASSPVSLAPGKKVSVFSPKHDIGGRSNQVEKLPKVDKPILSPPSKLPTVNNVDGSESGWFSVKSKFPKPFFKTSPKAFPMVSPRFSATMIAGDGNLAFTSVDCPKMKLFTDKRKAEVTERIAAEPAIANGDVFLKSDSDNEDEPIPDVLLFTPGPGRAVTTRKGRKINFLPHWPENQTGRRAHVAIVTEIEKDNAYCTAKKG